MVIAAKSGVGRGQLEDRVKKGARFIEFHLNPSDIQTLTDINTIVQDALRLPVQVQCVHIPIDEAYQIEGIAGANNFEMIENSCFLAHRLGVVYNKPVHVIIHQSLSMTVLNRWDMYDRIVSRLRYLLAQYPMITINLENTMILSVEDGKVVSVRFAYLTENVELCKELRKDLNTDRIGTVLDTCHALATLKALDTLNELGVTNTNSIDDFFKGNQEVVNVIHLANSRETGMGVNHGIGFETEEEIALLYRLLDNIKGIDFDGVLTLEVQEADYDDVQVFPELLGRIERYMG